LVVLWLGLRTFMLRARRTGEEKEGGGLG